MVSQDHAFNPEFSTLYFQQVQESAGQVEGNVIQGRELFYQLNHPQKFQHILPQSYAFISHYLAEVKKINESSKVHRFNIRQIELLKTSKIIPLPEHFCTQINQLECVKQASVILLTQPAWLQNISQISYSKEVFSIELMSVYLKITRSEQGQGDLLESYRSLILASHLKVPTLYSVSFSQQSDLIPEMIDFATIQLVLSRFPRVLFPEILGFTLAYCQMPTLIEVCFPNHQLPSNFFKLRQYRVEKQLQPLLNCIKNYLDQFLEQNELIWDRLQNGFCLYQLLMQRCTEKFYKAVETPLPLQQKIAILFQQKAAAAIGHHQKIQLQGKSLDSWFAGLPENNQQFLQALINSRYVNLETPGESLILKLFAFNGAMFGVLEQDEFDLLKKWLVQGLGDSSLPCLKEVDPPVIIQQSFSNKSQVEDYTKFSNRELYYYLVNGDLHPDVFPVVQHKIRRLLRFCSMLNTPPFRHYNHQRFESYIDNIYQQEISAYQPLHNKPKFSKEAYVWGLEQVAPMILIDGCWLQNCLTIQNSYPEISEILFSIYCDEIGNGKLEQNHPYIFQQLTDSLDIQLPPVNTEEFVGHTGFINSAFDLPVYMLSLAGSSLEFLPELLGLNMAIELSGLGNSYMTLVDEWRYWGIDSTIADIHISIDNAASGHTFLAKKSILLYMDNMMQQTGNRKTVDAHWRRIFCGYASLRFVGSRFKLGLPIHYLLHKLG